MPYELEYLVFPFLSKGSVNTIIGPSGAGKSKFLTQMFRAQQLSQSFLDYPMPEFPRTHYIGLDRSQREITRLVHKAQLTEHPNFSYLSLRRHLRKLTGGLNRLLINPESQIPPDAEHIIVDGVGFVVKDIIKQVEVGYVFADCDAWLTDHPNTTITLIHHTAKAKTGAGYVNPREKGLGSGAWAQSSAITISIEPVDPSDVTNADRIAVVMNNDTAGQVLGMTIDSNGKLILKPEILKEPQKRKEREEVSTSRTRLEILFEQQPIWRWRDLLAAGFTKTQLDTAKDHGIIEPVPAQYGVYRLPIQN